MAATSRQERGLIHALGRGSKWPPRLSGSLVDPMRYPTRDFVVTQAISLHAGLTRYELLAAWGNPVEEWSGVTSCLERSGLTLGTSSQIPLNKIGSG